MKKLFWWLVGLNVFDVLFTFLTIRYLGWRELNPMGLWPTLIVKTVGLAVLGPLLYWSEDYEHGFKYVGCLLSFAVLWYVILTVTHLVRTLLIVVV